MRNEVLAKNITDGFDQLNYRNLFRIYVKLRKIKLLRYLFNLKLEFEFNVSIFIIALEEDAYDIAYLIHKEFSYLMRENSNEENRLIISNCISSINKVNQGAGMIEEKCFLIREYIEFFQLRHARTLLDQIDKKVNIPNKSNIFVTNFNVVKTGCLLIELLGLIGQQFDQLRVRCKNIREKIEFYVSQYMQEVNGE